MYVVVLCVCALVVCSCLSGWLVSRFFGVVCVVVVALLFCLFPISVVLFALLSFVRLSYPVCVMVVDAFVLILVYLLVVVCSVVLYVLIASFIYVVFIRVCFVCIVLFRFLIMICSWLSAFIVVLWCSLRVVSCLENNQHDTSKTLNFNCCNHFVLLLTIQI